MRNRTIKNPEYYHPAKRVAGTLREIADDIEKDGNYINFSIQLWFASRADVECALRKKFPHATLREAQGPDSAPE